MKLNIPWIKQKKKRVHKKSDRKSSKILFLESSYLLKKRRKELGISRIQLAERTKITTSVLEAIENGWPEKLPEPAYLASMLIILENELDLKRNALDGILLGNKSKEQEKEFQSLAIGSIDLLRSWEGGLLYFILIISSIFGLNHQQISISRRYTNTVEPMIAQNESIRIKKEIPQRSDQVSQANELIEDISKPSLTWFTSLFPHFQRKNSNGVLEIRLLQKSKVKISGKNKYQASFNNIKGTLKLRLSSPITIKIDPQPTQNDQIIWEGKNYFPESRENGLYKFNSQ